MNRIEEYFIKYREYKENNNRQGAKEEINFLSQSLVVSKKLARAIADYQSDYAGMGKWMVIVDYQGKKYWEKIRENTREEKFQALENIFNQISEERK